MTLSVTYSCRAALARTPACPRPRAAPHPFVLPPPQAGPGRLHPPARRPPAPNLRRRPLGPRAACTPGSGPAGSATGDWQARALPASYLPRLGRHSGEGALPEKSGTPGSPGPCVRLRAPARARVNPFAAASCRSHPRSTLPPPPPPPARSPPPPAPSRCPAPSPGPALRRGSSQPPPSPAAGRGLPGDWRLGRAASPPSPEGRTRAPRAPQPVSPYLLGPAPTSPNRGLRERGSIP